MTDYWYIWYEVFENGESVSRGRYHYAYSYKGNAVRRAKQMWSKDPYMPLTDSIIHREWIVSQTNPWNDDILKGDMYVRHETQERKTYLVIRE